MAKKMTLPQFGKAVRDFLNPRSVDKAVKPPMRRTATRARSNMRKEFKKTELGRRLWGRRKTKDGPPLILTRTRFKRESARDLVAKFSVKGMAALIDMGGETESHKIEPRGEGRLVFEGTGQFSGQTIAVSEVDHPGSIVRRKNIVEPSVAKEIPRHEAEIAAAISEHVDRAFG